LLIIFILRGVPLIVQTAFRDGLFVDLHRKLTQEWPFIASKIDPSAAAWIVEKVAIRIA